MAEHLPSVSKALGLTPVLEMKIIIICLAIGNTEPQRSETYTSLEACNSQGGPTGAQPSPEAGRLAHTVTSHCCRGDHNGGKQGTQINIRCLEAKPWWEETNVVHDKGFPFRCSPHQVRSPCPLPLSAAVFLHSPCPDFPFHCNIRCCLAQPKRACYIFTSP